MDNQNSFNNQQNQDQWFQQNTQPAEIKKKGLTKSQKLFGIISISLVVLLTIAAVLVYKLWYQNPQKVVFDAIQSVITAKSHNYTGTFEYVASSDNSVDDYKVNIDFDLATIYSKSSGAAKVNMTGQGIELDFDAEAKIDNNGVIYFKGNKIEENIDRYVSQNPDYKQFKDVYADLIKKIDGKWLKFDVLKNISEEKDKKIFQCQIDVYEKYSSDTQTRKQVADLYKKHQFVVISDNTQKDSKYFVYGVDVNEDKLKEFIDASSELDVVKDLNVCGGDLKETVQDTYKKAEDEKNNAENKVVLYIDKMSHKLDKVETSVSLDESGSKINSVAQYDTVFNSIDDISMPENAENIEDIVKEFQEKIYNSQQ